MRREKQTPWSVMNLSVSGYLRDPHSERDYAYGAWMGKESLPAHTTQESIAGPPFDQGATSMCVCYAMAGLKRVHEYKQSGALLSFDAAELYSRCKAQDGTPSPGTYPRTAFDIVRNQGMLADDGHRYKVSKTARLSTIAEIKHAVVYEGPVLIGLRVASQSIGEVGRNTPTIPCVPTDQLDAAHAVLIVGYDNARLAFRIRNSWGLDWAEYGLALLPFRYLSEVDPQFDAWSSVDYVSAGGQP